jgi:hypothetical protein
MSIESKVSNLEQSKWLKQFFEKYEHLKPETSYYYFGDKLIVKIGEKHSFHYYVKTGISFNEHGHKSDKYCPSYFLDDIEKVLPETVSSNGHTVFLNIQYLEHKTRSKAWFYDGNDLSINIELVKRLSFSDNSFDNIINLLKILEKKGVIK